MISSRYAKALLEYAESSGTGDKIYSQAQALVQMMRAVPQLEEYVQKHDDIKLTEKLALLSSAIEEPLTEELKRFVELVASRRRIDMLLSMLLSYISKYRKRHHIKIGSLVTAVPDDGLKERLESMFGERTGGRVRLHTAVNPELIGGFVFELDDYRIDASVRTRIEKIRRCLVDDSSRII